MRVYHYLVVKNLGSFLLVKPPVTKHMVTDMVVLNAEPWWKTAARHAAEFLHIKMDPPETIGVPARQNSPKLDLYFRADDPNIVQWTRQMMALGAKFDGEIATLVSSAVSDRDMTPVMTMRGCLVTKTANTADGFAVRILCDVVE